jgi:hypothetical protein
LREHHDQFETLGVKIKIVTFDRQELAQAYVKDPLFPWPLLLDSDCQLYTAYGFPRGSFWALLNPVAILGYTKLILTGTPTGRPGKDLRQLGGDVLIDPTGTVRFHYRSKNPLDRPPVQSLLNTVRTGKP